MKFTIPIDVTEDDLEAIRCMCEGVSDRDQVEAEFRSVILQLIAEAHAYRHAMQGAEVQKPRVP